MTIFFSMAIQDDVKGLNDLQKQISDVQSKISRSSSATAPGISPATKDISANLELNKLKQSRQALEDKVLKQRWYGDTTAQDTEGERQTGLIEKGLNALSRPLYAVVGAAEALTGKGSVPGFANIAANIKEKENFGDLLRKFDAPNVIATPLGFAMDVAFDPVNWMTAGTEALIPRIGEGLLKGGVSGAAKGAESGILKKVAGISRLVPGFNKEKAAADLLASAGKTVADLSPEEAKAAGLTGFYGKVAKLQEKAFQSGEEYNKIIGSNLEKILEERKTLLQDPSLLAHTKGVYLNAGDIARGAIENMPFGEDLLKAFDYNPKKWFKVEQLKDKLIQLKKEKGQFLGERINPETGEVVRVGPEDIYSKTGGVSRTASLDKTPLQSLDEVAPVGPLGSRIKTSLTEDLGNIVNDGKDAAYASPNVVRSEDPLTNAQRMLGEAGEEYDFKDLVQAVTKMEEDKTGIKIYDDLMKGLKEIKVANKPVVARALDTYGAFVNFFKATKVSGLSPSSVVNSALGNPTMAAMAGLDVYKSSYYKNVTKAWNFLRGKDPDKYLQETLYKYPELMDFITNSPNIFGKTFGLTPEDLMKKDAIAKLTETAKTIGVGDLTEEDFKQALAQASRDTFKRKTPLQYIDEQIKSGNYNAADLPTSLASQEIGGSKSYIDFKQWAAARAANGDPVGKVLNYVMTKPVSFYERIDQSFKLGNFMQMTVDGLDENEILKLSRFVKMGPEDIINKYKSQGRYLYRLAPSKAAEAVNEIYMNYAAMPGAIKVLRSMPILGSPFASFAYAMGIKTAKTAMYNPAIFNKINFLLDEISGPKSPLEKEALKSQYYSRFGQQGMVKLPFFTENPMYLNVANMIPYYSLNLFNPSERKYGNTLPDNVLTTIDRSPFLKDPVGQVIFDYLIQPMLLQDASPQNAFGSPLYPSDASPVQKTLYAGRQLAEAIVPPAASYLGFTTAGLTPEQIEAIPSYRWRQISNALNSRSTLGISSKEGAAPKTLKALSSSVGLPVGSVDLSYAESQAKKSNK